MNEVEAVKCCLGKFFVKRNSYEPPDIVRVVGWTKAAIKETTKIRYVFVEYIDVSVVCKDFIEDVHGGHVTLSFSDLNDSVTKIDKPIVDYDKLRFVLEEGRSVLTKGNYKSTDFKYYSPFEESDDPSRPSVLKISFCNY